jgi:hypothetical protein
MAFHEPRESVSAGWVRRLFQRARCVVYVCVCVCMGYVCIKRLKLKLSERVDISGLSCSASD